MVSLCMIVKDDSEAEKLRTCLMSAVMQVDKIYITGTNKPDKEIQKITKDFGATYSYFKWTDDFAEARNFNFAQADPGDWVLWLDADDELQPMVDIKGLAAELTVRQAIKEAEELGAEFIHCEYLYAFDKNGVCTARQWKPRIVKNTSGRWIEPVHEHYIGENILDYRCDYLKVKHHKIAGESDASAQRNLRILLADYAKRKEPRTIVGLANTYYSLGQFETAIGYYDEFIKVCNWDDEKYTSLSRMANCFKWLGKYEQAAAFALMAINLKPDWSLAYFDLGDIYSAQDDFKKAIEWLETGFAKKTPDTVLVVNDADLTINPTARLAYCYLYSGRVSDAYRLSLKLPSNEDTQELKDTAHQAKKMQDFVKSFLYVVDVVAKFNPGGVETLLNSIGPNLEEDAQIMEARAKYVQPKTWGEKSVVFLCGNSPEEWTDVSLLTGIGGSESAVIYLSREFTKLGYDVTVFNKCGTKEGKYMGVEYKNFWKFNPNDAFNVLIVWRNPGAFINQLNARVKILDLHDVPTSDKYTQPIVDNVDYIFVKSEYHKSLLPAFAQGKAVVIPNGIKAEPKKLAKRPYSIGYFSSYDRGLIHLLSNWPQIRKAVPEATLDVAYGWNSYDKMGGDPEFKERVEKLFTQPGITHHGRISKKKLHDLMESCQVWAYPTNFEEISCMVAMETQTLGCYPVVRDYAALKETVIRGVKLSEDKNIGEYTKALIKALKSNPEPKYVNKWDYADIAKKWEAMW